MSIALMNEVWKTALNSTRKMVLLALADNANDQGECYPSINMLAQKCSLSDRAIRKVMGELESSNFLRRDARAGRSTVYHITDPGTWFTPEQRSPRNVVPPTPERGSGPPRNVVPPTPERGSPITIKEPSVEPSRNHQGRRAAALVLPDWLPAETWAMWDRYRRSLGKGWTDDAMRLSVAKLDKLRADGFDPTRVIENAIERGWRGIYPPKDSPSPPTDSRPWYVQAGFGSAAAATAAGHRETA